MSKFPFLNSMPGASEWIFILVFGLAFLIFWVRCIIEIATSKFDDDTSKIVWLLIVVLTGLIGALIYTFFGRKSRITN